MASIQDITSSSCRYPSLTIAVEGNIGAGKSTFLEFCNSRPNCTTYPEPVAKWQNLEGTNLLSEFYADRTRWAVPFQLYAGMTVLENYQTPNWHGLKFIERSLLSSQHVFLEHLRRNNTIAPGMCAVLNDWYRRALIQDASKPTVIVYLRTDPATAYARVSSRGRGAEGNISLQYITEIHSLYEAWIAEVQATNLVNSWDGSDPDLPVFVIDADRPLLELYGEYESCLEDLRLLSW